MLDQYTADALRRPQVLSLAKRVKVVHESSVADGEEPWVDVVLKDGSRLTDRIAIARGDSENPLSEDELVAKFRVTAGTAFGASQLARIEKAVREIEKADNVRELESLMCPAAAGARQSAA